MWWRLLALSIAFAWETTMLKWSDGHLGLVRDPSGRLQPGTVMYSTLQSSAHEQLFEIEVADPAYVSLTLSSCVGRATISVPTAQIGGAVSYQYLPDATIASFYKDSPGVVQLIVRSDGQSWSDQVYFRLTAETESVVADNPSKTLFWHFLESDKLALVWKPLEMSDGSPLPGAVTYVVSVQSPEAADACGISAVPAQELRTDNPGAVVHVDNSMMLVTVSAEVEINGQRERVPYIHGAVGKRGLTTEEIAAGAVLCAAALAIYWWKVRESKHDSDSLA